MMQEGVARRYLFGFSEACDFRATNLSHTLEGSAFTFHAEGQSIEMYVPLIGKYNLVNALAALSLAYLEGIDLETLKGALCTLAQIPGRMQRVDEIDKTVFVDYAHKPEALEKVLVALAPFKKGKIITLFGCGGMRDQIKRPKMASIAERLSDQVIITSDNPRREDPVAILEEIASGFTKENYEVIEDRREAIYRALEIASKDDIILIAGKGHEKMQYLETKSIPFDDVEVAKEFYNAIH
jgi:UDP-N-acetylmuramoyl-L-alanyl-D-glutamate--2,6-diaminopimelate ligase